MAIIRFALEWPRQDLEHIWRALLATEELRAILGDDTLEICYSVNHEMLLEAAARGEPYDGVGDANTDCLMAAGVLQPIDEWVAHSRVFRADDYLPEIWRRQFHQGRQYGVPAFESGPFRYGFQYNARLVREAGLDPDQPPQTYDEAFAWHQALTRFDAQGRLVQLGLDPHDAMGGILHIADGFYPAAAWGWDWYDPESRCLRLDCPEFIDQIETTGRFFKHVGPERLAAFRAVPGQEGWGNAFNAGTQAMISEGYCNLGEFVHDSDESPADNRCAWMLVPAHRKGARVQLIGGCDTVIFRGARHGEKVFRLAEFLNTPTACDIIYRLRGYLPARLSWLRQADRALYPGIGFYLDGLQQATEIHVTKPCPVTRVLLVEWRRLRELHHRGQLAAAAVAHELQAIGEAALAQVAR